MFLVDITPRGQNINSEPYIQTLKKTLQKRFNKVWAHKNVAEIHLNTTSHEPYKSMKTRKAITKLGWAVLAQPYYSPRLAPSDFQLFEALR